MRIVGVDDEGKDESATLVHPWEDHARVCQQGDYVSTASFRRASGDAVGDTCRTFVWGDGECEVEEISGILEMGLHGRWEVEFCQIWNMHTPKLLSAGDGKRMRPTFLDTDLSRAGLWLLLSGRLLGLLHAPYL